jgi:dGTP triphosphohydrolase
MKNLHLKNLKELDLFDINMEQITKIETELEDKIYSLIKNTLQYLINQLENIKIVDPTIKEFKDYYLNDIKTNKFSYLTRNQLQNIKEFLIELENIKNLTIGSIINTKDYEYSVYYDDDIGKTVYEVYLMSAFLTHLAPGEILILEVEVVNNKIREIIYHS